MVKKENSKKNKHLLPEDRREIEECLIISPDSSMCQPIRAFLSTNNIRFEIDRGTDRRSCRGDRFAGDLPVPSGKIEGINSMMKTIRRSAYGRKDNEYSS